MVKIGLTGNVASGKSTVAEIWARAGVPVILADDLAREVVAPGSQGLRQVAQEFGSEVLKADGSLDRAALRHRVFRDPSLRKRLENILHPLIGELRNRWVEDHEQAGSPLVVAEIPLLFETGMEGEFDLVVLVLADTRERLRRLVQGRGLEEAEALRIMEAQLPVGEKIPKADFILENNASLQDLEIRALALLDMVQARTKREGGS
jgi:dephospho-CoA kinase